MAKPAAANKRFRVYAWTFVGYLVAVVLFGAWVRITHAGAGCGDHWPTCRGQVVPFSPTTETIIEYTHRLTSAALGLLGVVLVGWAWRLYSAGHRIVRAAMVTLVFLVFESLIGAGLVLGGLVADNDSVARAVVIAIHLVNTLALTGAATLTAWWSTGAGRPRRASMSPFGWLLGVGLVAVALTSVTGAITALGDTLFPVDPTVGAGLVERVRADLGPAKHFLVRLRIAHPVVATATSVWVIVVANLIRSAEVSPRARGAAAVVLTAVCVQLAVGAANIYLGAPGWMQLVHLALAQLVWMALLITANEALADHNAATDS